MTNFKNPFSGIEIQSIRITSYATPDCSGDADSSTKLGSQYFNALSSPAANYEMTSSSDVLGDSDPGNKIVFKFTPVFTAAPDGRGLVNISIPPWYNVLGKYTMMYNLKNSSKRSGTEICKLLNVSPLKAI